MFISILATRRSSMIRTLKEYTIAAKVPIITAKTTCINDNPAIITPLILFYVCNSNNYFTIYKPYPLQHTQNLYKRAKKRKDKMKSYEDLLKKAQSELPEHRSDAQRFTIEKVNGHIEGSKTIISNLKQIAKTIGRDPNHLLKYLLRETASAGKFVGTRAIFPSKISASAFNKKIKKYASEFVYCSECDKPDTSLIEDKGVIYLRCQACGAKKPVKNIK